MTSTFEPPELKKKAFTCPHCGVFAAMNWENLVSLTSGVLIKPILTATCHQCGKDAIWLEDSQTELKVMLHPKSSLAPMPNDDLPTECMKDYVEAREIVESSPRGAAALLHLCVQRLVVHLGGTGKHINDDIALLVQNGLPVLIQQALDVVRVVGNNAVHPGEIVIEDQPQTALALFGLINLIVENQITQPKHVADLFASLHRAQRMLSTNATPRHNPSLTSTVSAIYK